MEDWKITRDRQPCERPGCPLPGARQFYAVLDLPDCLRRELCDACFVEHEQQCRQQGAPPVFWRAVRKASGNSQPVLDLVSLRALFDRLDGESNDRARALRYFCALLLLRKRMLKMARPTCKQHEGADLVLRDPKIKDMEPIALFAPPIDLDDLGPIKDDLLAAISEGEEPRQGDIDEDDPAAAGSGNRVGD